jgi:hypothetical protein
VLKTETNTREMERRAKRAWRTMTGRRDLISADFEHGQWWISALNTGEQWSVVDATGGLSIDGFDFEKVSEAA